MAETDWIAVVTGALAGALVGALGCRWRAARLIAALEKRLQMSEFARHAMQQRSDQARLQVGQLTKALADAHRPVPPPLAEPMAPQPAPAPATQDLLLQRADRRPGKAAPESFPDTQVL